MTRQRFPDFAVPAPSGQLCFEAVSPDNGTPLTRDGKTLEDHKLGFSQSSFRFRLIEIATGKVRWERWQAAAEPSPTEAFLSEAGWLVVRANDDWSSDRLTVYDPAGAPCLVVVVRRPPPPEDAQEWEDDLRAKSFPSPFAIWEDDFIDPSTGGPVWLNGALAGFYDLEALLFVVRLPWGRRLIVDLDAMELSSDVDLQRLEEAELSFVRRSLSDHLVDCISGNTPRHLYRDISGGLTVAAGAPVTGVEEVLRRVDALPVEWPDHSFGRSTAVFGDGWNRQRDADRMLVRLGVRRLGIPVSDTPCIRFAPTPHRRCAGPLKEVGPAARSQRLTSRDVPLGADPWAVLETVGTPDFVESTSVRLHDKYAVLEVWSYDNADSTVQVRWSLPTDPSRGAWDAARVVEEVRDVEPPEWRGDQRLLSLLDVI